MVEDKKGVCIQEACWCDTREMRTQAGVDVLISIFGGGYLARLSAVLTSVGWGVAMGYQGGSRFTSWGQEAVRVAGPLMSLSAKERASTGCAVGLFAVLTMTRVVVGRVVSSSAK